MKRWQLLALVSFPILSILLAIYLILFTPLLDMWDKLSIRNNLPEQVNRIAGIKVSKDVKVLKLVVASAMNGEKWTSITLELTEKQKQEVLAQVRDRSTWHFGFFPDCQFLNSHRKNANLHPQASSVPQNNSYTYSLNQSHLKRSAIFCLSENLLLVSESN